eukprot:PITA_20711
MEQNLKLTSIEGKEFEDATKYRQLVGSLIYLTTTRPDISFAVRILSRFMQKPYFDGEKETGVSTSRYAMSLGSGVVSWRSRKQSVLADSTTEAECVVATEATKEIVWLRKILEDLQAKTIHLCHCSTNEKIADIFTKALGREKLERFRTMLGLTNIPSD